MKLDPGTAADDEGVSPRFAQEFYQSFRVCLRNVLLFLPPVRLGVADTIVIVDEFFLKTKKKIRGVPAGRDSPTQYTIVLAALELCARTRKETGRFFIGVLTQ